MRATVTAFFIVLALIAVSGCGQKPPPKTPMELKDVPPNIMKVAKEKLPGVTFDSAFREANGSYELRGKEKNGKVREIDIRPDGTVEEIQ